MRTCAGCNNAVGSDSRAIYCSHRCRNRLWARKKALATPKPKRFCTFCGHENPRSACSTYCSKSCKRKAELKRMSAAARARLYAAIARYSKNNPEKRAEYRARRRAVQKNAMPAWLTPEHHKYIAALYRTASQARALCGEPHEVDHIVPLQGKNVCGLHVPWNLRMLPRFMNREKGSRYIG